MKTIFKYHIEFNDVVEIPEGGQVLSFQYQNDKPTIWVLVDPTNKPVKRKFSINGTGWELPDDGMDYIGTTQDGGFVWHLFELSK